ncbi:MAG: hypothetical protein KAQ85_10595 [Thermodesulfovibrionia bacterium]|nr:hypothetical protein [Thermodesulfovibrionia bacterium]
MVYNPFTREELEIILDEIFKNYKSPITRLTPTQQKEFDKALKKEAEGWSTK